MEPNKTALERAFELAQTGRYLEIGEIKLRLHAEGYSTEAVTGPTLYDQLKRLMGMSQKTRGRPSLTPTARNSAVAKATPAKSRRAASSTAHV
jgi:hypothetical protein